MVWHLRLLPPLAVRLREQGSRHVFHFLPSVLAHAANRRRTRRGGAAGAPAGLSLALRWQRTFCCSAAAQATSHVEWCGEQSPAAGSGPGPLMPLNNQPHIHLIYHVSIYWVYIPFQRAPTGRLQNSSNSRVFPTIFPTVFVMFSPGRW